MFSLWSVEVWRKNVQKRLGNCSPTHSIEKHIAVLNLSYSTIYYKSPGGSHLTFLGIDFSYEIIKQKIGREKNGKKQPNRILYSIGPKKKFNLNFHLDMAAFRYIVTFEMSISALKLLTKSSVWLYQNITF